MATHKKEWKTCDICGGEITLPREKPYMKSLEIEPKLVVDGKFPDICHECGTAIIKVVYDRIALRVSICEEQSSPSS